MRLFCCLILSGIAFAAEPIKSGVPEGKRPGPYSFLVATGAERGQLTCFICAQEDKPGAIVFARKLSDPLGKLMAGLDRNMENRKEFKAWLTVLAEKADLDQLAKWAQSQGLKAAPVGVYEDADGPPAYALNADAEVTVLVFEKKKVLKNYAFKAGELTDARVDEILKTLPAK